jgi:hypothetical protein
MKPSKNKHELNHISHNTDHAKNQTHTQGRQFPEAITHLLSLQANLISVENEIDSHGDPQKTWDRHVLEELNWLETNCQVQLGSKFADCLDRLQDIVRHGGPIQGNSHKIGEVVALIAQLIQSHKKVA